MSIPPQIIRRQESFLSTIAKLASKKKIRRRALRERHAAELQKFIEDKTFDLNYHVSGFSPLSKAAAFSDNFIITLLLQSGRVNVDLRNDEGRTALSYAAQNQAASCVERLMCHEANHDSRDNSGRSPLSWASTPRGTLDDYKRVINHLTSKGANMNSEDDKKFTPLTWATVEGLEEVVSHLLSFNGVNVNCKDAQGRTPLLYAAKLQHSTIAHLLITSGADVNLSDKENLTPLMCAAIHGYENIARDLLASGRICVDCQDRHRRTALSNTVEQGHSDVAELLIGSGANINAHDERGCTPLTLAAIRGHDGIVAHLLSIECVNADLRDVDNRTPLSYAAESGYDNIVRPLVESGADINSQDATGRTPLVLATMKCHQKVVLNLLSDNTIDLNHRDRNERTPLSYAAELGLDKIAEYLLASGADVNMEDREKRTPLLWASIREHYDMVTRLLSVDNVFVDHQDIGNRTALSYAAEAGNYRLMEKLMDAGADGTHPNKEGHSCMWLLLRTRQSQQPLPVMGNPFQLFFMASRLLNPDFKDQSRRTLLSWAAEYGDTGFVHALLENGADANIQDSEEPSRGMHGYLRTPIIWALQNGHKPVIQLLKERDTGSLHLILKDSHMIGEEKALKLVRGLLNANYNIEQIDAEGKRPLHIASNLRDPDFARALILAAASLEARDNLSKTPLHYAFEKSNENMIKVLLENGASTEAIKPACWFQLRPEAGTHIEFTRQSTSYDYSFKRSVAQNDLDWIPHTNEYRLCLHKFGDISWSKLSGEVGRGHNTTKYISYSHIERARTSDCSLVSHLSVSFPCKGDDTRRKAKSFLGIEWGVRTLPKGAGYGFVSTLPNSRIPESIPDFFSMFLSHLQEVWEGLCAEAILYIENIRDNQLERQGKSRILIDRLARNARKRTELRRCLQQHIAGLRNAVNTDPAVDVDKKPSLAEAINNIQDSVTRRLDEVEALVRELLQIELAWASINEAGSIKRLSWIAFIFLPLMFVSSLFGMNIDLLKNSPDWRWSLLFGGFSLLLTASIWSILKYLPIESWLEERRFMRKGKRMGAPDADTAV